MNKTTKHYIISAFWSSLSVLGLILTLSNLINTLPHLEGYFKYRMLVLGCALLFLNGTYAALFLFRNISKKEEVNKISYLWAILGTYIPQFFNFTSFGYSPVIDVLIIVGTILSGYSVWSLGKSMDIIPSNRGLVLTGAYKYVRHPIYATFLFTFCMYLLVSPLYLWRVIAFIFWIYCVIKRISYEEELLLRSAKYQDYCQKVKYKLIPGLW